MTVRQTVQAARRGGDRVLLEGVHALKHAVRFDAEVELVVTPDRDEVAHLLARLAPDVVVPDVTVEVDPAHWRRLCPRELPSPVLAVARRPTDGVARALADRSGRVVVLEQPRHLGNLGAAVRVTAAAGAAGLVVVGDADPWQPTAVRAAAGLQLALPIGRVESLPSSDRPLVALAPGGPAPDVAGIPRDALVAFGTERGGLSAGLRERATSTRSIPMRKGVSSLNLATAVAVALYTS